MSRKRLIGVWLACIGFDDAVKSSVSRAQQQSVINRAQMAVDRVDAVVSAMARSGELKTWSREYRAIPKDIKPTWPKFLHDKKKAMLVEMVRVSITKARS